MSLIHWEFFMSFDQFTLLIVNLLAKSDGRFVCVHFF